MNADFQRYSDQLPILMEQLKNSNLIPTNKLQTIPRQGIYVFYDKTTPLYVGRSNNMKDRIQSHGRPGSRHGSATFAFILAREKAGVDNKEINTKDERKVLENNDNFKTLYKEAKERVSNMSIRVVGIEDQILQTLFEVYAAVELKTKYNEFGTH
jgi:predicted GIY-YIG superfamily endonuclease